MHNVILIHVKFDHSNVAINIHLFFSSHKRLYINLINTAIASMTLLARFTIIGQVATQSMIL